MPSLFNAFGPAGPVYGSSGEKTLTDYLPSQMKQTLEEAKAKQNRPIQVIEEAVASGRGDIQQGLSSALSQLSPYMQGSQQAYNRFQQELFGTPTATKSLPGYESMLSARGEALEDLATGRAGLGKLFSGSTGEQAAQIGGGMEQQLRNQYLNMLMGETAAGRQMAGQAAGMQYGAGTGLANLGLGGAQSISNILFGQQQAAQAAAQAEKDRKSAFWGDLLGAAGTVGGFLLGGPGGAAAGAAVGSSLGGQ